ncbi:hypothetical protein PPL_11177 [Heterostelium album PN500]|uniref:Major facilitator superfamily (MFS) profile domain-containing protein n=1 Tax=Heterostelium pallidum (strain ATCC 26659 / Pp 5 / PN500) TaxID=670386 RepID=D3BTR7_HETP5|nr:hypothetical protein PPL_11177 [Heterostelium album PN500]EFA75103.1 hypothetical protein PPL_11177 [Heterostelium album PN500]|eukprot:XP_020427237.1 hypothetical protein PPL_11177 [Heterostelium album PN500]
MEFVEQEILLNSNSRGDRGDHSFGANEFGYLVVGRKTPRRFWLGLSIILCTNIALSIISVTIWPYLTLNRQSIYILAVSIAAFHTGSTLGRKLFSYLGDNYDNLWSQLMLATALSLVGDLVYAIIPEQFAIITSRFVVGVGAGSGVVLQNLLAKGNDHATQKSRIASIGIVTSLAYIFGPALIAAFSKLQVDSQLNVFQDVGNITIYGWLASTFSLIALLLSLLGKIIDKAEHKTSNYDSDFSFNDGFPRGVSSYRSQQSCIFPPKVTLVLLCFIHFMIFNSGMILETVFIPYIIDAGGYSAYNWSLTNIALFFVGLGVSCAVTAHLSKKITNNNILLYSSLALMCAGYAFMTIWKLSTPDTVPTSPSPPLFRFLMGVIMVAIGFPTAISSSITLFFELMSTVYIKYASTLFQFSSNFGRLMGPIWAALIFDKTGVNYSFLFGFVLSLFSIILLIALGRSLKYISSVSNIQRNVPILTTDDEDGAFR